MDLARAVSVNGMFKKIHEKQSNELPWLYFWSFFLAIGWILPNHYLPWVGFHTDIWVAGMFLLAGVTLVMRFPVQFGWTILNLTVALMVLIPVFQYVGGLLVFSGQVWITSAYLLGLLLSLLIGAHWERQQPGQAFDTLFFAISLACIMSVGMQLYQWAGLKGLDPWIVNMSGNRPFANLVQPNQLATLLLWGVISVGWFSSHKKIGTITAMLMAMFFLLGIALTQSRTPILAMLFCIFLSWFWREIWYTKKRLWIFSWLILFFIICSFGIGYFNKLIYSNQNSDVFERIGNGDIRLKIYFLFFDAVLQKPYFGYGWTNVGSAQMLVAENHDALGDVFQHAHNLLLDLMLWVGIPIGLLIFGVLVRWFWLQIKGIASIGDALLFLFVLVFFVHSMLELPHQYAYMLFPIGLVMGGVEVRTAMPVFFRTHYVYIMVLLLSGVCFFGVIIRDYFRIESDFMALRFERAYGRLPPAVAPQTLVLSQLEAFVKMGRMKAYVGMSHEELRWMHAVVGYFPSPNNQYLYMAALALNGYSVDAQRRMNMLRKIMNINDYVELEKLWVLQSKNNAVLSRTKWLPIVGVDR
jgi:O-antigen ligase